MNGPSRLPRPRSLYFLRYVVSLLITAWIGLSPIPLAARQSNAQSTPAPGVPELMADGTVTVGNEPLAWRISSESAASIPTDAPASGPSSFVIAGSAALEVTLPDTDDEAAQVAPGDALFVPVGPRSITTDGEAESPFHIIAIEEVSPPLSTPAPDPGVLLASEPFTLAIGTRAVELWMASLTGGPTWTLPTSDAPIALLVTAGAVETTAPDMSNTTTLVAGEAGVATGGAQIRARGTAEAVLYAAVIGDPVEDISTTAAGPTAAPTSAETGTTATSLPTSAPSPTATTTPEPSPTPSPTAVAVDSDGDGLSDEDELMRGTNPSSNDSDGDGVFDGYEVSVGLNPLLPDSDGDGMSDYDEVANDAGPEQGSGDADADGLTDGYEGQVSLTNPYDADSDDDGLNDGAEISHGSNPLKADTDGDSLLDGHEVTIGTSPLMVDTDGDFLWDSEETRVNLNPTSADTDGDGLTDGSETDTSPYHWDSDRDGLGDGDELYIYGTSPIDYDTDNDCDSDGEEIANGTSPFTGEVYVGFECTSP